MSAAPSILRRSLAVLLLPVLALATTACGAQHDKTALPLDRAITTSTFPAGTKAVAYRGTSFAVPTDFRTIDGRDVDASCGAQLQGTVVLGHLTSSLGCPSPAMDSSRSVVWIQPLADSGYDELRPKGSEVTEVAGSYAWLRRSTGPEGAFVVVVPSRDTVLSFSRNDRMATDLLSTIRWG